MIDYDSRLGRLASNIQDNSRGSKANKIQLFDWRNNNLRATFCNHRSRISGQLHFFQIAHIFYKDTLWWFFLKIILKTSSNSYSSENVRIPDRAPEVPIFEYKLVTKAQYHRVLQKSPTWFKFLTKPSLSFPLHVRHDKVSLSKQMTISHVF